MASETNPAEVQPDQGQGQEQNGLYPDLSAVPEDVRELVTPLLKQFEGNVTKKFQENAEYRKQWEPFQELGVHEMDPTELSELLQFRQIAADPDQFQEWYRLVGEEMGLQGDPEDGALEAPEGQDLESMVAAALDQRLGPIEQSYQAQAEQQRLQEAETFVSGKLAELEAEHGEYDKDAVCQLALAYDSDPQAIERGFADYQRLIGAAEKSLLSGKLNQPEAPEKGGSPATQVEGVKTFDQAKAAARQLMQQSMGT